MLSVQHVSTQCLLPCAGCGKVLPPMHRHQTLQQPRLFPLKWAFEFCYFLAIVSERLAMHTDGLLAIGTEGLRLITQYHAESADDW